MNLVSTLIEPGTVKMERLLPGPVERIWAYLTESDKRATWLAGGEFDLRVGGKVKLEFDNSKLPNDAAGLAKHPGTGVHAFTGRGEPATSSVRAPPVVTLNTVPKPPALPPADVTP